MAVTLSNTTLVLGIEIPSASPVFLIVVGFHILIGLSTVIVGAIAMLSAKGKPRHIAFGRIYYWCLAVLFASTRALAWMRWDEDYQLFVFGGVRLRSCDVRSFGREAEVAELAQAAHHGNGVVIYLDAHRILCR